MLQPPPLGCSISCAAHALKLAGSPAPAGRQVRLCPSKAQRFELVSISERLGFEPRDPIAQVNSLAVSCFRPLSHLSRISIALGAFLLKKIL